MANDADLWARIESGLPSSLPAGAPGAVFAYGSCASAGGPIERLALTVNGARHAPAAQGMPRPDLEADPDAPEGAEGFWACLPVRAGSGGVELGVSARIAGGAEAGARLATVPTADRAGGDPGASAGSSSLAVCMATFDPDPDLLRVQLDSLRAQTETDWSCVVSDDCSRPELYRELERQLAGDDRFSLSRAPERLGFYRNFERALGMVPKGASLVALCDQDDRWHPDKLATLRTALGDSQLVYSDARLVAPDGSVLAETMWRERRNNHTDLASVMVANTITGAASLFRRDLLNLALPFPEAPGWQFHDHWLGSVALASGSVAYVDRALYDYTQHGDAVLRGLTAPAGRRRPRLPSRPTRAGARRRLDRARARYFYGYVPVQLRSVTLLERGGERISSRKRRALSRLARADGSLAALVWLWARRLRSLAGRSETDGTEGVLAGGLLWRRAAAMAARMGARGRAVAAAGMPPFHPDDLESARRRRRRGTA